MPREDWTTIWEYERESEYVLLRVNTKTGQGSISVTSKLRNRARHVMVFVDKEGMITLQNSLASRLP